jgi:hypothetical protein
VTTPVGWVSDATPASGQGSGNIEFRAATNPMASTREGEIVVNDIRVRVVQEAAPCRFAIAPDDQLLAAGAVDATVAVATNGCTWRAQSNAAWITITSGAAGSGDGVVSYRVASNSGRTRSGTLTIAGLAHTITQVDASAPAPPPPSSPVPPQLPGPPATPSPAPAPPPPSGGKGPKPPKAPKPPKQPKS